MNLVRSFATVGGYTLASRLLGFVRDMLIAAVLGTGPVADAFFVAFRFPNLFRRLFAEGAFNSAFVPLFARELEGGGAAAARRFGEDVLAVLLWTLLVLTALAEIAMPWLMYILAPGFAAEPDKFDLAVMLTRIAFPYLLCMSMVALLSGVLNSLGRFAAAAAAPVLLNVILIAVLAGLFLAGERANILSGQALAWGVAAAGAAQLAMLAVAARRAGMAFRLVRPRLSPKVRRLVRLGVPGLIAGGVTQFNIVIGTIIASLQAGAVSYLYYAERIYQLPLGVVGIAIGIVLLPELSRRLRAGNEDLALRSQNRSLEFAALLTLPAAAALAVAAHPIVQVLFERGAFTQGDIAPTALALIAFSAGLPAFVAIKVFSPGFFAREDTRTPMNYAIIGVAVNVAGSLALYQPLGHVGIAIATTLSGWVNAALLVSTLGRRGHFTLTREEAGRLARICLSALAMAAMVWLAAQLLAPWLGAESTALRASALALLVVLGAAIYIAATHVSGGADLRAIRDMLTRRT
ncbi:MAG: murein biosynthesis integral membrane protein MurJ [Rhodobiaceae bacterium]|nr:murein biosynthesis integral membrane protein MurJ [Rhodobiaceae bacterium]